MKTTRKQKIEQVADDKFSQTTDSYIIDAVRGMAKKAFVMGAEYADNNPYLTMNKLKQSIVSLTTQERADLLDWFSLYYPEETREWMQRL